MGLLARFPGTSGDYASTPDNAAFSAFNNFSVVALVAFDDWTPTGGGTIASHFTATGNQRSWTFRVNATGFLVLQISTGGTAATTANNLSTSATGFTDGTMNWVLVTRASVSGDIKFYTASYTPGTFTPPAIGSFSQLGMTVTGATGTLHNSTAVLEVGSASVGVDVLLDGDVRRVQVYAGLYGGGSEVLLRDFSPTDAGDTTDTSWTAASTGETWTLNGGDVDLIADTVTGVAAGAATASGSAVGVRKVLGVAAGSASASGSATGLRTVHGVAAGAATASGTAIGTTEGTVVGTGAGAATSSGTATGLRTVHASAAGAATAAGSASGTVTVYGTGTGGATSSGSASGSGGSTPTPAPEEDRFGGSPISVRDIEAKQWDEQLERLLREDEELLCLI